MLKKEEVTSGKNAYFLKICAIVQLVICLIASIFVFANYSTILGEPNWYQLFLGIGLIIFGFTVFFLLRTIVDIYIEIIVEK